MSVISKADHSIAMITTIDGRHPWDVIDEV